MVRRALILLIPTVLLIIVLGVGGAQQTDPNLFHPLDQVYQTIKSYFYEPERIDDQQALYGAMEGLVEQLNDPYSEFLDPAAMEAFDDSLNGEFSGVGIEITLKDGVLTVIAPLEGTPADKAGVRAGDQIIAIDGESTDGITLTEAAVKIRGEIGTTVTLTVLHTDGSTEEIPIIRDTITVDSISSKLVNDGRIAYIRLSRFDNQVVVKLDTALNGFDFNVLDGVILDLRNNPGGLMNAAISVSSRFVDEGIVVSTKSRISGEQSYWSTGNILPNLPLAVLINAGSASASEITAGAIRDHQMGVLIGEQSFGKGVIQQLFKYGDGAALKLTTGEYTTPLGHIVHEVGLTPDIVVTEEEDPIDIAIAWIEEHVGERMPIPLGNAESE
ncbi:MAG: S41 family peptidase [Candidatus Bipolaricaulota bacterium]|nr:S41 family peptidase [Candidatus Bipolaricaulota bacterium]